MNPFGISGGATGRERQLEVLLESVHQAQQLARARCSSNDGDNEAKLLFGRLEAVRLEIEELRRANDPAPFEEIDPKWIGKFPWQLVPEC